MSHTPNQPTALFLLHLNTKATPTANGWQAKCPAHDDRVASLSIANGDADRCVLYCQAGCNVQAVVEAVGLTMSDLFPPKKENGNGSEKEIAATYDYQDEEGNTLYQVVRYFPKAFKQRRPDGMGGWTWNLRDVQKRVLYRANHIHALDKEATVWIVEGEKDVHSLERMGIHATTNIGGAGKWRSEYNETLRDRHVIICPDNDAPGKEHAKMVENSLRGIAASCLIIELPGLENKGDISEWIQQGHTLQDLMQVVAEAEKKNHKGIQYLNLRAEPTPIEWLVDGWIATNDIVLMAGRPGGGKSTTAADLAIAIAGGRNGCGWLGHKIKNKPVLYLDEEAGEREIIRQFQRQGGRDLTDLHVSSCNGYTLANTDTLQRIEHDIQQIKPGLIVLDTASKFFAGANENDANEIAALFVPLMAWREKYGVATLIVHHMRKLSQNGFSEDLMDRIRGSSSFTSQPSAVWTAVPVGNSNFMDLAVQKRRGGGPKRTLRIEYQELHDGSVQLTSMGEPTHAESAIETLSRTVSTLFQPPCQRKRIDVVRLLPDHDEKLIDKALLHLLNLGILTRPSRGWYSSLESKIVSFPQRFEGESGNPGGNEGDEGD